MAAEKFAVLNGPIRCRDPAMVNEEMNETAYQSTNIESRDLIINDGSSTTTVRSYLANYFLSSRASLPWHWKVSVLERILNN